MAWATGSAALPGTLTAASRRECRSCITRRACPWLPKSIRGLPVSRRGAVIGLLSSLGQWAAVGDERGRAAAFAAPPAPLGLGPRQVVTPVIVLGPGQLGVYEAVDGLVGNDGAAGFQGKSSGHLLGRPTGETNLGGDGRGPVPGAGGPGPDGSLASGGRGPAAGRRRAGNPGSWSRFASTP